MPTWALWATCMALIFARALVAAADSSLFGVSDLRAKELSLLNPEMTAIHYPLGMAYRGLGELEKAAEHLEQRATSTSRRH